MNTRYPFLRETPLVPPLSACISSLKGHINDSEKDDAGSSLYLLESLLADMKSQLDEVRMQEMDSLENDIDLNQDRANFIRKQVLDAKHWLDVDIAQKEDEDRIVEDRVNRYKAGNFESSKIPASLFDDTAQKIEEEEKQIVWNNNFVRDAHLPLSQHIVAYENEDQKNGFERVVHSIENPFEEEETALFVKRMKDKYENVHESNQEGVNDSVLSQKSVQGNDCKGNPKLLTLIFCVSTTRQILFQTVCYEWH